MINYSFYKSKIGILRIGTSGGAVCEISVTSAPDISKPDELADLAFKEITEYLKGERRQFDFPIALNGTDFQKSVWSELIKIPYGKTKTYGEIAALIGKPCAARAVGSACNKNPLLLAVPCHRVLGKSGSLTGFAAGLEAKKKLLETEKN